MLTAEEHIGSGSATISGYDVATQSHKCWQSLGFCPQHDALWPELKTREHLILFASIKNEMDPQQVADSMMRRLDLMDKPSSDLSGGNRRKLSAAIAMIGRPKAIFLDEPSSGMDVATRRNMWTAISESLSSSSVVLTTHSMEEAEALSSRIAIMVNGTLRCIGTSQELKSKFGSGYILEVLLHRVEATPAEISSVEQKIQCSFKGAKLSEAFDNRLKFVLPSQGGRGPAFFFHEMEACKIPCGIRSYSISQPTLEQMFFDISSEQLPEQQDSHSGSEPGGSINS
jgi:ABC-type multidrug transport system ATPase subunit